jgi:uncharacterized SAM-binding protein YcdF (DUF218 family)
MIFVLSKILLFLIKPIVWFFVLLIFAIASKNPKKRKRYLIVTLIFSFFFTNAFIVGKVMNDYQAGYPKPQKYDVGIVLYKKGQIKQILLSGGSSNLIDRKIKEGDLAIQYLKLIGIPDSAILIENQSRNTIENARYSLALIAKNNPEAKILVVTSAWHIPRAKLIFDRQAKRKIEYYPTNFIGNTDFEFGDFIIPSATALATWELLFKEWTGLIADCVRA